MKRYLPVIGFCAIILLLAIIVLIGRRSERPAAPPDKSEASHDSSVLITFKPTDPHWRATAPDKTTFRYTATNSQPSAAATRNTN
jgi:hypothetical protein